MLFRVRQINWGLLIHIEKSSVSVMSVGKVKQAESEREEGGGERLSETLSETWVLWR